MKRCPKCRHVEADDTLAFCRADGTLLVRESDSISEGAGTLKFGSAPVAGETETRILPNYATAHQWYGELLSYLGRFEESFAEFRRALEIDPLSLPVNWNYGVSLNNARRSDEAIAQLKRLSNWMRIFRERTSAFP